MINTHYYQLFSNDIFNNLNYYDACYKICALSTILNSSKENVVAINDNLIAKTKLLFMMVLALGLIFK